jgi:hypothetical protein
MKQSGRNLLPDKLFSISIITLPLSESLLGTFSLS